MTCLKKDESPPRDDNTLSPRRIAVELGFAHDLPESWPDSLITMISLILKRVPPDRMDATLGLIVRACQHFSRLDRMGIMIDHQAEWRQSFEPIERNNG